MQWPEQLKAGAVYEKPVISLDVYATAAELANSPIPDERGIDGVNLIPFLLDEETSRPHELLYWRLSRRRALRLGDWKLVSNPRRGSSGAWELYNLTNDLDESEDLAQQRPKKRDELLAAWRKVNDEMREPIWQRGDWR